VVKYLLRNKLRCGYCGQPISAETGTSKTGKVKRYYKCLGRKHHSGCKKSMIQKERLENLIIDTIISELSKPKIMDRIVSGILAEQERQIEQNSTLRLLVREKKRIDTAIENMLIAIERGVITNTTARRLKELEAKQEELESKILIEQNRNAVRMTAAEVLEYYREALKKEAQALINYLIKEVVLYDDKIEIYFNKPTRTSPDDNQGFSVFMGTVDNIEIEIII
jgi:hypothetical protein